MNDTDIDVRLAGLVAGLLMLTGFAVGVQVGKRGMERAAAEYGYAKYVADKRGDVEFIWNTKGDTEIP